MGESTPMNFWNYRNTENIRKFLSAFLVLAVFCLGAIFFVHAAKQPKLNEEAKESQVFRKPGRLQADLTKK